jgi:hypothetical protein
VGASERPPHAGAARVSARLVGMCARVVAAGRPGSWVLRGACGPDRLQRAWLARLRWVYTLCTAIIRCGFVTVVHCGPLAAVCL